MKRLKRSLETGFSVYHVCLGVGGNSVIYSLGAVTIPLLSVLMLGNPSRPFASQYGGFYE